MVRETPGNFLAKILQMAAKGRGERQTADKSQRNKTIPSSRENSKSARTKTVAEN